eukprot:2151832-Amphidinium_carterae.1
MSQELLRKSHAQHLRGKECVQACSGPEKWPLTTRGTFAKPPLWPYKGCGSSKSTALQETLLPLHAITHPSVHSQPKKTH